MTGLFENVLDLLGKARKGKESRDRFKVFGVMKVVVKRKGLFLL